MIKHRLFKVCTNLVRGTGALCCAIALACQLAVPSVAHATAALDKERRLPVPEERQSVETVFREVGGVAISVDVLAFLPMGRALFVTGPWKGAGASREQAFGPIEAQSRHQVSGTRGEADLVGLDLVGNRWLLLDGLDVSVREVAVPEFKELIARSIAWDQIKPPADRGGEPTRVEIAELRAKFKRQWLRTLGRKLTGWARINNGAKDQASRTYLVGTRIPGFPLLQMQCSSEEEPSSCMMVRQCFIEGAKDLDPAAIAGVGYSAKRHLLYIGDAAQKRIHVFRYDSCFHAQRVERLVLPDKLKQLTNIHVDADDRLWVTTVDRDDYLNASIYYWPKP